MAAPLKLTYWNIRGLAQPIRMLLECLGVPYEETRLETSEKGAADWQVYKAKNPDELTLINLPFLIDGDFKLTESAAILRYIAAKHNETMLGKTPEDKGKVEQVIGAAADLRKILWDGQYHMNGVDEKAAAELRAAIPETVQRFSEYLGDKKYAIGGYLTIADFSLYEWLHSARSWNPKAFDKCPNLKAYTANLASLPNIKEYIASDKCIQHFNDDSAPWKGPSEAEAVRG